MAFNQADSCKRTHDAALAKLKMIEEKIDSLNLIKLSLEKMIGACKKIRRRVLVQSLTLLAPFKAVMSRIAHHITLTIPASTVY